MQTKMWYQSSTLQGLVVMLVTFVAGFFIPETDANALAQHAGELTTIVGQLVGAVMVARGRANASTSIAWTKTDVKLAEDQQTYDETVKGPDA